MNIHIQELLPSDNISALVEKINQNFDQLLLAGGGPEGPVGPEGNQGISGPSGIRGSQWFTLPTPYINLPTDGVLRTNDFALDTNGDVFYFDTNWTPTNINIKGPIGPKGDTGDGSISIIKGELHENSDYTQNQFTPNQTDFTNYLSNVPVSDLDDYEKDTSQYINAGIDFVAIGRGNNSLVLGRLASLFKTSTSALGYTPATGNKTINNFPANEYDVPMLLISQNDYQNPNSPNVNFKNGISIGLTKTHEYSSYTGVPYSSSDMNYNDFTNLSITNRYFDFGISSKSMITLQGDSSLFRLGVNNQRQTFTSVDDNSTKLVSPIYTNFVISDNFVTELTTTTTREYNLGSIVIADYTHTQTNKIYNSPNDSRNNISKSFFTNNQWNESDGNEIVLVNTNLINTLTTTDNGKKVNSYTESLELNSNHKAFPFRIGQTVVNPKKMTGIDNTVLWNKPTLSDDAKINIAYQGFGYDQCFIQYSGIDNTNEVIDAQNSINQVGSKSLDALLPNDPDLSNLLGYDITKPFTGADDQQGSRSMSRIGLYPGIFRKEKSGGGFIENSENNRKDRFFDVTHRMLPTGSLDLFGTVRLREQETTDGGQKDGWVAINKKDGILSYEEPNLVNATPTYSIQMFSEHASDKFSFWVDSGVNFSGTPGAYGNKAYNYKRTTGATAGICGAFVGKGTGELKDFYICNGAVLADERDCIITGPYSQMKGINVNANQTVENGAFGPGTSFLYKVNPNFIGKGGQTHDSFTANAPNTQNLSEYGTDVLNNEGIMPKGDPSWGYSVVAPTVADSGFRIVLPNYFGKVPKMILPDSDFIIRAVHGDKLTSVGNVGSGFKFYTSENTYNWSWIMKGSFDTLGFPYLLSQQLPDHKHELDIATGSGGGSENAFLLLSNASNVTSDSTYMYRRITYFNEENQKQFNQMYYRDTDFSDMTYSYDKESNWWIGNLGDGYTGQKFIDPPFKGTYLAINLKGVRNPNRQNTLIKDFHYVAGVPVCGIKRKFSENEGNDMSWYSHEESTSKFLYSADKTDVFTRGYDNDYNLNLRQYGYKSMLRNDNTMHPYTYYSTNESENNNATALERFNQSDAEKDTTINYKTHMYKDTDFQQP